MLSLDDIMEKNNHIWKNRFSIALWTSAVFFRIGLSVHYLYIYNPFHEQNPILYYVFIILTLILFAKPISMIINILDKKLFVTFELGYILLLLILLSIVIVNPFISFQYLLIILARKKKQEALDKAEHILPVVRELKIKEIISDFIDLKVINSKFYLDKGEIEKASEILKNITADQLDSDSLKEFYIQKFRIIDIKDSYEHADIYFQEALNKGIDSSTIYYLYSKILYNQGKYDEVKEILSDRLHVDENNRFLYFYLALSYAMKRDYKAALKELLCAWKIELKPNKLEDISHIMQCSLLRTICANTLALESTNLMNIKNDEESYSRENNKLRLALKLIDNAFVVLERNKRYFSDIVYKSEILMYKDISGYIHYKLGDLDKAIDIFKECITLNKNHWWSHFHLGLAYKRKGETNKAKLHFVIASNVDERHIIHQFVSKQLRSLNSLDYKEKIKQKIYIAPEQIKELKKYLSQSEALAEERLKLSREMESKSEVYLAEVSKYVLKKIYKSGGSILYPFLKIKAPYSIDDIKKALNYLIDKEKIKEEESKYGTPVYKIKHKNRLKKFLDSHYWT